MDFIELGYDYSLGVRELDRQHVELERLLNETVKHCTGKRADEKKFFDKNSKNSIEFLKKHFETEENLLIRTKYEHFHQHKSDHNEMLKKLIKMHDDIEKKRVELDLFYVTAFIKEMVMKHIKTYDLGARKYFIEGYEKTTAK